MAQTEYIALLEEGWRKDIEDAKKEVGALATVIVKINEDLKGIEGKMGASTKLAEVARLTKELEGKQRELNKVIEDAVKAREKYDARVASSRQQLDQMQRLHERLAQAQSAEAVEAAKLTIQIQGQNAANRSAASAAMANEGSLVALRAELRQVTTAYDALSKEERENIQIGGEMQRRINEITAALSAAEQGTGRFQRNVGNYASAVTGFRGSFQQIARELPSMANGMSTFFMAIGNNVPMAIDAFKKLREEQAAARAEGQRTVPVWKTLIGAIFNWQSALLVLLTILPMLPKLLKGSSDAADEAEKAHKRYTDSLSQSNSRIAEVTTNIGTLKERFFDAKATVEDKKRVVDELNKTYGDTIGKIGGINEAEAFFVNRSEAYIRAITLRAQADGARELMSKNFQAQLEKEMQTVEEAQGGMRKFMAGAKVLFSDADGSAKSPILNMVTNLTAGWKTVKEKRDAILQEDKDVKDMEARSVMDSTNTRLSEMIQGWVREANAIDQKFSFKTSIQSPKEKKEPKGKAPYVPKDFSQETAAEMAKIRAIEAEGQRAISEDQKAALLARINALRANADEAQAAISERFSGELQETKNSLARIEEIEKKSVDKRTDAEKDLLLQRGLLETRITRIIAEEANERAKIRTDAANRERKIVEDFYKDYKAAARIAEQYLAEFEAGGKRKKGDNQEEKKKADRTRNLIRDYQQAGNELASISSIQSAARIAELDAETEAIKRRYDGEVESVQNSLLSQQEKADKIKLLREKEFQEEQVVEAKRKNERRAQAEFEKELAIANIIINTALAISKFISLGDIPEAIAAGVLGATQLAVAIATPIPQYAKGTDNHPKDGPAIVGDGGRSEYVVDPEGNISLTPSKPTLMYLKKGTRVFPSAEDFARRYEGDFAAMQMLSMPDNKNVERAIDRQTGVIEKQTQAFIRESRANRPLRSKPYEPEKEAYRQRRAKR